MKYRIEYTARAESDLDSAFQWIAREAPGHAARWRKGMIAVIESLRDFPKRCPLAPEADAFKRPIHQLIYGKRHGTYRILFTVIKQTVYILHIRHSARDEATTEDS